MKGLLLMKKNCFSYRRFSSIAVFAVIIYTCNLKAQNQPSQSDDRFQQILKRFPEADTNKDGVLTQKEFRDFNSKRIIQRFPQADTNKDGVLSYQEFRNFQQQRRKMMVNRRKQDPPSPPTHANVKYGSHKLQGFDLWLAKPKKQGEPTPLCIFIHGGGFRGGDKSRLSSAFLKRFLDNGISFAAMNYRLTDNGKFPYPTAMLDCAKGLQFIRSKASEWNINPKKIACFGGSAGAGISMWLAFHDDLAKPDSSSPIEKQSTRIIAAGSMNGQSTYDMRTFQKWFGVEILPTDRALVEFYAIKPEETIHTPRVAKLAEDASPINHLTSDDPPVFMVYGKPNSKVTADTPSKIWVHHPLLGLKLQEAMHKLKLECIVTGPGMEDNKYQDICDFLIKKLSE